MNLLFYKSIAAILILFISLGMLLYPLSKKKRQHAESTELGEALASGIFLGAAFFHMLPDAITIFDRLNYAITYPLPEALCVLGFLLLLFLERLSLTNSNKQINNAIPYIVLLTLTIHALTEGAALGIGTTFSETVMIFIAILAHKSSETFALCVLFLRYQFPLTKIILLISFFAFMTPIGISLGAAINLFIYAERAQILAAVLNAFAAGTFLYISTLHHVHFHHHAKDTQGIMEFLCLVLGVIAMATIAVWN